MTIFILQVFLALVIGTFCLYTFLEWHHAKAGKKIKPEQRQLPAASLNDPSLPTVSVLLPIYDEDAVVEKLIKNISSLQYPPEKLDIWLLDDSPKQECQIAKNLVAKYAAQGIPIYYAKRKSKRGNKAGNLSFGLTMSHGDIIAIFDADYMPPADFLLNTVPYFAQENMGFLQTSVDYSNKRTSFLTRFQAMMAEHKEDITTGQEQKKHVASLTGSSCLWRRSCIADIGGIKCATVCEDTDMGVRAQLHGWQYTFIKHVSSLAELPETMAAFRVQRERWARGHVQNSLRHSRKVITSQLCVWAKLQALVLLFSSSLLASFYAIVLLTLPTVLLTSQLGFFFHFCCSIFLSAAVFWALGCMHNASSPEKTSQAKENNLALNILGYVLMFFPLSLHYFYALCYVLIRGHGKFNRTPKGKCTTTFPIVNEKLLCLEILSFVYALTVCILSFVYGNYWVSLYSGLAFSGFGLGLFFSWRDTQKLLCAPLLQHVFITGASGAIGKALALQYAQQGTMLTLHGRNTHKLEELAEQCKKLGAQVRIREYDLGDTKDMPAWVQDICTPQAPDLCFINAGLVLAIDKEKNFENTQDMQQLWQINVVSSLSLIDALIPHMRHKGSGQIAIISSLASYFGLPATPSYCASKAALRIYADALRNALRREGIHINAVMPGSIESPMLQTFSGPRCMVITPQKAARIIQRGLAKNKARILFPFPLSLGCWALSVIPHWLALPIIRWISRVL